MAIILRSPQARPQIDLSGPDGNAVYLIGAASKLAKQMGMDKEEVSALVKDMMSSDYEHVVRVFDKNFGDFVDLILPEGMNISHAALDTSHASIDDDQIVSSVTFDGDVSKVKFNI